MRLATETRFKMAASSDTDYSRASAALQWRGSGRHRFALLAIHCRLYSYSNVAFHALLTECIAFMVNGYKYKLQGIGLKNFKCL